MSFIDKDQRITSWQTKTKHNFIETSVTSSFLSSFFPSRLELTVFQFNGRRLLRRPYICRLFLFFLPPRFVYISVSRNCSELAFVLGLNMKFGPTFAAFLLSHRPLVELRSDASETYKIIGFLENIRVPFDCKQQILAKH